MATSLDTRAFTGTYPVELPTTGLFGRASESQVTVASSVFAPEIRSAPPRCLTRPSSRSLITQHFFLFARAIRPQ